MQHETRICGHCGKAVSDADITCPHCGALLAAYEAPAGSTSGTMSATTPVAGSTISAPQLGPIEQESKRQPEEHDHQPAHRYESVTAKSLDDLDDERPTLDAFPTTEMIHESPVTEALKETRIAADLDKPEPNDEAGKDEPNDDSDRPPDPPMPSDQPIGLAEARQALGLSPKPETEKPRPKKAPPTQQIATSRPRSAKPDTRARSDGPPIPEKTLANANPRQAQSAPASSGVSIQSFVGLLFVIIIVARLSGSHAFFGAFIIPVSIIGLIAFMRMMAKNTGRKSTSMPKHRDRRR
ncbi:MAG TPA: zinc ribbon domain-containing protein [Thermomicrobiales bacterium]|nr:zinc ribbon domain-containing protein [Thermomicrobiales bacterium]